MIPWRQLDRVVVPGGKQELALFQRDAEFSIRIGNTELMNSRMHGSEEALAELACRKIVQRPRARVLVGGLGMGFTLSAVLREMQAAAQVVVAELVPAVVTWNRGPLAPLAGEPLTDPRVSVREQDVVQVIASEPAGFDAILLDVDNGPQALTREGNQQLYGVAGLRAIHRSLREKGVLTIWSSGHDAVFARRLRQNGFEVEEVRARARGTRGGARHVIWVAQRMS